MPMRPGLTFGWIAIVSLAVLASGCNRKAAPKPPPPPTAIIIKKKPEKKPDPTLPAAPSISPKPTQSTPPASVEATELPPPPQPTVPAKKRPTRAARKKQPIESKPAEAKVAEVKPVEPKMEPAATETATTPAPPAPAVPKLGVILSPEQIKDYNKRFDASHEYTKSALLMIQGKILSKEQRETVFRIEGFIAQAEQAREQDLAGALSLAERAELLSRDLLDRLR